MSVMEELRLLLPELIVALSAIAILLLWAFSRRDNRWMIVMLVVGVNLVAAALNLAAMNEGPVEIFSGQITIDRFAIFFRFLFLLIAPIVLIMAVDQLEKVPFGGLAAVLLFSTSGMMLVVGATDLITILLAIELMSIPIYVLTAFTRTQDRSGEAAVKYFVMGAFATAVFAYGIAWTYGITGQTSLAGIAGALANATDEPTTYFAVGLILVGLGFKVALIPFHAWTPDAYEGAPTPVTAFMSVGPKLAALALLVRFVAVGFEPLVENVQVLLLVLAALTMIGGNLIAVTQTNVKRMLAYSSIAHSGYMLAGIAAATRTADGGLQFIGLHTLLFYGVMYAFMNIGAFAVVFVVERRTGSVELSAFRGLARRNLMPALMLAAFMLSLTGVPPLAGFFGKLFIIQALVAADLHWLALVLVLASVVSAYFYLRVIVSAFMLEPEEAEETGAAAGAPVAIPDSLGTVILVTGVATLALGVFSNWLYQLAVDGVGLAAL